MLKEDIQVVHMVDMVDIKLVEGHQNNSIEYMMRGNGIGLELIFDE